MGLFDFLNNMPTRNEMNGSLGEWLAKVYAKTFPDVFVLHDVLINGATGYTSQIDLILVGSKGLYVIEMKMFNDAKIYGDVKKVNWYYYNHGKKYEIYSPLEQNKRHINYLKVFLKDFGDMPLFSVITMVCDDFKVSGKMDGNTAICNSIPAMEKAIYKLAEGKPDVLDKIKKQEIFDYIKKNQHLEKEARSTHKQNVISYKKSLEELQNQKKCPYCKSDLVLRNGANGEFYGCKNFPRCRYTLKKQSDTK